MADMNNTMFSWVCQHTPKVPDTQEAGTGGSLEPKQHNEMCGWVAQWQSEYPVSTRPWVQSPSGKLYKSLWLLSSAQGALPLWRTLRSVWVLDSACGSGERCLFVNTSCCPCRWSKVESTRITSSWIQCIKCLLNQRLALSVLVVCVQKSVTNLNSNI